jgi:hypothetical protein
METFYFHEYPSTYNKETGELVVYQKENNEKIKKPSIDKDGYYCYQLRVDGKSKQWKVHRIIGTTFIPNPEEKGDIDHINRNRQDNRLINLRWATRSENNLNTSFYGKGYCWIKQKKKWQVKFKGKFIGYYKTEEEAAEKVKELRDNARP